jgi:poly(3-hydroxybutyrate) depolymerase
MNSRSLCLAWAFVAAIAQQTCAVDPALREYVNRRAAACSASHSLKFDTPDEWSALRTALRHDLQKMLGLSPFPQRRDLRATVTGSIERGGVVVEKLHFQSLPGLYVTANFYRPAKVREPLPTILYLCGHSRQVENGVSFGNKVGYQHHGAWFARNGYCCLAIDTLQLGEIEGVHHGTHREGMWWWVSRGYTPAGVEAFNAMRALDYLETRTEVDRARIGVTGRSGGGAYTWWVAALDDRPACFVPVAGITDLANHVVDGCIEGHCDCMYMVNRLGWDFGVVACLAAPRPCLLANSDRDPIFPLDGVIRIHSQVRQVYRQLDAVEKLGLTISEGPHKDTQELQLAAFRWFNRWLRGVDEPVAMVAEKLFTPAELKVFDALPTDAKNGTIHETFLAAAPAVAPPDDLSAWNVLRRQWLEKLRTESFAAWPQDDSPLEISNANETAEKMDGNALEYTSEPGIRLRVTIAGAADARPDAPIVLHVIGEDRRTYLDRTPEQVPRGEIWAFVAPRGCEQEWTKEDSKVRTHLLRRFVLVGTTLDEGRVWDIRRAVAALRQSTFKSHPIALAARGTAAGRAVYASLFSPDTSELLLQDPPASHREGPTFINVLRVLDMPQAVALALPRPIRIRAVEARSFSWAAEVAKLYPGEPALRLIAPEERDPGQKP